jgi:uncharacterized membrane protein
MRSVSSRGERLPGALLVIIIVAAALRAFWLTHQSLWTDEAVTYFSSIGSPARVVSQREVNSNIPPLYYLIVNVVLRFGAGDLILRLPSVVAGVLSIPVFFVVVRRWLGVTAGLCCAAGLAVSPFHVWYSQEARPYALLVLLSLVAMWCLQHALAEPNRRYWRAAFVVSAAAVFATHTIGLAFVAFTAAVVLLAVPRAQWRDWLWTFVATGALMVPAIYRLVTFPPDAAASSIHTFHILHMPYAIWSFATGYSLGPGVAELHVVSRRTALVLRDAPVIVPVLTLFAALFIYAGLRLWQREKRLAGIVAAWFAFPMALAIMGPMMTVHPFNVRYAILAFPPFMMLIGLGVAELRWRPARAAACAAIAIVSAVALYGYYLNPRYYRDDNRGGAHFIASHSTGHELVIVSAPFTAINLRYYDPGYRTRLARYPPAEQEWVDSARVGSDLGAMLGDEDRFWLFLSRTYDSDPHGYLEEYCEQHFRRGPSYVGTGVRVIRYELETARTRKGVGR